MILRMYTRNILAAAGAILIAAAALHAQGWLDRPGDEPFVTLAPVRRIVIAPGRSGDVALHFRIRRGFHINSNEPRSELLIPTQLVLKAPNDLLMGRITYPPGEEMAFEFAPDEPLSVYDGDFTVTALVRAAGAASPGTYRVRGELKYQPCNDVACFPPATLPVQFDVRVQRPARRR